jgi:hypothetical protein
LVFRIPFIHFLLQFGVVAAAAGAQRDGEEDEDSEDREDEVLHGRDGHRINKFLEN